MSTTDLKAKYPPTAVRVNTSYNDTHASLIEKARSMLDKLEDDGVVHSFSGDGNVKYYARCHSCSDSLHLHSHPHFQCVSCEKVRCLDFEVDLATPQNLKVTDSQILLKGQCELCLA